jgi:hypothetical protein
MSFRKNLFSAKEFKPLNVRHRSSKGKIGTAGLAGEQDDVNRCSSR